MALEALISLRHQGETATKKRGDVLCVKLAGSPWGELEQKFQQVVEWEDDALEAQLVARKKAGEPHPVISCPYAETDRDGNQSLRSKQFFDVETLPREVKTAVMDSARKVDRLSVSVSRQAKKTRS